MARGELSALITALKAENHSAEQLLETLVDERAALGKMDPDQLGDVTARKTELLVTLEQHTKNRLQVIPVEAQQNLAGWLQQQAGTAAEEALALFSLLRSNSHKLAQTNRVNGSILKRCQQHAQQTITLFTGNTARQPATYDAAGNRTAPFTGQPLGAA